jgi:hypothetical protein
MMPVEQCSKVKKHATANTAEAGYHCEALQHPPYHIYLLLGTKILMSAKKIFFQWVAIIGNMIFTNLGQKNEIQFSKQILLNPQSRNNLHHFAQQV